METLRTILSFDIGIKNLAYTLKAFSEKDATVQIIQWDVVSLIDKTQKIPSIDALSPLLFGKLDDLVSEFEQKGIDVIHYVLIENQPSRANGTMKTIQSMIYSYFHLRRHWEGKVDKVCLVSPKNKLMGHAITDTIVLAPGMAKYTYKYNKWMSCQITRHYIEHDAVLLSFYDTFKKKDDLSDTLLQGISWIYKMFKVQQVSVSAYERNINK